MLYIPIPLPNHQTISITTIRERASHVEAHWNIGNIEEEEVGQGPDPDPEAGEEDRGLGAGPSQGEGLDQDPDPEGDPDPIHEIPMESLKVDQGASKGQKVGQGARIGLKVDPRAKARAEKRRGAALSQVLDPNPNPDPAIEKRLFEHIGISLN